MLKYHTIAELRQQVANWRQAGERIALVPTMGNLHEGHLHLVEVARSLADRTVASIFVNPLQFGPNEDFDSYPRTLDQDSHKLTAAGLDLLFAPSVNEVYPRGLTGTTRVTITGLTDPLCGRSRPGHFDGVATVVTKLFNMVQPDIAVFGEKDRQQLRVIEQIVTDLNMPVTVVGVPIVREADGLAMSSRNRYLSPDERRIAPELHRQLQQAAARLRRGERYTTIEVEAKAALTEAGFRPDYFEVRRTDDLDRPTADDDELAIFVAAWLGRTRLIDNLVINEQR